MTNSEEGKKILEVLRSVRLAHAEYNKLPACGAMDERHFIALEFSLENDHSNLCCSTCCQYNDECTCQ